MRIVAGLLFAAVSFVSTVAGLGASAAPALAVQAAAEAAPSAPAPGAGAQSAAPPAASANPLDSPLHLFAALEEAWLVPDAERLASLVDTTSVRIGIKPGVPPAAAMTRSAAVFLFQDQLRLVKTHEFRVLRLEVSKKGGAKAVASWEADWGGRQGVRTLEVKLTAALAAGGRWLLTEVRADD